MPKRVKELPELSIKRLKHTLNASGEPYKAVHAIGGVSGLYLQCLPPSEGEKVGAKQWLYRSVIGDKRRWIGLGGYPSVPTKSARKAARELQDSIQLGIDPIAQKRAKLAELKAMQAKEITFEDYARQKFIPIKARGYKSAPQVRRLSQLLRDYVFPHIGNMVLEDIRKQDIVKIIEPLWETKNETARRVQNYIQSIIEQAISDELREKGNCAVWKDNLETSFVKKEAVHTVKHHRSIHWKELPKFIKALQRLNIPKGSRPEVDAMLLMILTVGRPQEVRFGDWKEIDLQKKVWHQPKGKYKSKKLDWDIPLCTTAINILKAQPSYATKRGRIFSTLVGEVIPDTNLSGLPDALGFDAVAHGYRSTFHTWTQEKKLNQEVASLSMKHTNTDATRAAYARSQLFDDRKKVLRTYEKWAMTGEK